ncbi:hypothetical protein IMZ68_03080 [Candidatus Bathyarchaeota archaeon]|nr:hypothetical protein [Candidatus Bathyarchaeota archaeon]MBE3141449.1 hypothetical protein [Thermoplasmata archaeon]
MGSGCFPINAKDKEAARLLEIKKLLEEFRSEWYDSIYSGESGGGQYDNAASDGGYLERIGIAIEMIDGCLYTPKPEAQKSA